MNSNIQTIIWDLDGTLLDSFGIFVEAMVQILPRHGKTFPGEAVIAANYHGSLEDAIRGAVEGNLTLVEIQAIIADFMAIQDTQYEVIEGHLFPDAERLAQRAHAAGIRQIVVTNRDHEGRNRASPRSIVAHSNLKNYIDLIIAGDDSEHRKPKPEVLGKFIHIYVPETTLVIGDQFVDADFALKLGARGVLVSRNSEKPHHLEKLAAGWESMVTIVKSLDDVSV